MVEQVTVIQEIVLIMLLFLGVGGTLLIPAAVDIRTARDRRR
jgi:hypothetical protein